MADDSIDLGVADYLANPESPVGPRLKDSLFQGVQRQPDMEGRMRAAARDLGVPLPAAFGDKEHVLAQHDAMRLDPNGMVLGAPRTANWLSEPDNAAVSHDDVDVLKGIEQTFKNLGKLGVSSFWGGVSGMAGYLQSISPLLGDVGIDFGDENSDMGQALTFMRKAGKQLAADNMPQTDNPWAAGVNSGIVSLAQNAPAVFAALITKNPALLMGSAVGITGGQAYGDARDKGKSRPGATAYGAAMGGIEGVTEAIPAIRLVDDYIKGSGLLTTVLHQFAPEVIGEQIATLTQDLGEWAYLNTDKPFSEYLAQRPDAAIATLVATGVGIGGNVTLEKTAHAVQSHMARSAQQADQAARAQQTQETLTGLFKAAETSALRQRDPQTFKEYVDAVTTDSPVESVYINAADLVNVLAQGSPEKLAENVAVLEAMPSVMPQLEQAAKSGGLVQIPVSELLAFTPDTQLGQALIEHLKVDPEAMSMAEGQEFLQSHAESFKQEVAKVVEANALTDEFTTSAEAVRQEIKDQLDRANRFTPDVNEAYAALPAAFYATQAARLNMTPQELFAQHPLAVQAQGVTEGSLLNQYVGEGARTANPATLEEAKRLTSAPVPEAIVRRYGSEGVARQAIANAVYRNLGWFQGEDGKWRFEISDRDAAIKPDVREKMAEVHMRGESNITLGDMLDHEPLYEAYPELRTVKARLVPAGYGGIQGITGAIAHSKTTGEPVLLLGEHMLDRGEREAKRALMHEVQHLIQATEGFAKGASTDPNSLRLQGYGPALADEMATNGGDEVKAAETVYQRSAGEVEARDTEQRAVLSEIGRKEILPRPLRGLDESPIVVFRDSSEVIEAPAELNQDAHISYDPGLGFRSTLFDTVLSAKQAKASADQWLAMLHNTPGIKKEELEWIGLPEALALMGAEGAITREQILTFVAQHGVRLEEVVQTHIDEAAVKDRALDLAMMKDEEDQVGLTDEELEDWSSDNHWHDFVEEAREDLYGEGASGTSYSEYQAIKGGENYREVLIIMPRKNEFVDGPNGPELRDVNARLQRDFTAGMGHWSHDNVLAHIRLADFTTPDGKRALGVLEIQSDWHQKGRDKGYAVAASPEEQAAAQQAWDGALAHRNTIGKALDIRLQELLPERLRELEAQRLDFHRQAMGVNLPATPDEIRAVQGTPEYREASETFRRLRSQAEKAADAVNRMKSHMTSIERTRKEPYTELLSALTLAVNDSKLWGGTDLVEEYVTVGILKEELTDARLTLQEADQRLKQSRGEGGIPDAPFKAAWPALSMKRVLREAIEQGYDKVIWTTGEQQADLYDMREHIDQVTASATDMPDNDRISVNIPGRYAVTEQLAQQGAGEFDADQGRLLLTRDQAASVFGVELGHRIYDQTMAARGGLTADGYHEQAPMMTFEGADLTVGGEGHKAFYNRNLVNITNDIIKKFGTKVGVHELKTKPEEGYFSPEKIQGDIDARQARIDELRRERDAHAGASLAHTLQEEIDYAEQTQQADREALARVLEKAQPKQWGFEITEKMRSEEKAVSPPLFQGDGPRAARGSFNPQTSTITLLRNADLSTFLHETGHFFLETLAKLAADPAAPAAIREDWDKAATFIGFGGADPAAWLSIPVDGRRDGHETFARGFEAYLREGRAPAAPLKGIFQRFKSWLVHVYQSLNQLNVELTPEVRGVFDRLLASEQEIAQAEQARAYAPVFDTKPEGMSDLEWEAYQRLGAEATADAQDALQSRSIRDMRWLQNTRARLIRQLSREAREKRKAVRAEVEAEVMAEPVYAAQQFLKRGTMPAGVEWEGPHKLALADVEAIYDGVAPELQDWQRLGYGRYGMLAEDGLHPDQAAELLGFSSGHELVEALLNAEPVKDKIEGLTDQRMLERYGDLTDPEAVQRAADEAIHNDARLRFVATEASALAKAAGSVRVMAEAARDFARDLVGRQRIRDLKPGKYTGAETRAATASARAAAKGDLVTAATEKRNQLINGYAAKAAFQAQKEVEAALRFFARVTSVAARKGMDADYRDQIDALLERFDLRKGESLKAIDKRKSLAQWIKAMEDRGLEPVIDGDLANEAYRKHYKDLTVDELRGLVDAIKNIVHLGRLKNRLLMAAQGRAFDAVRGEMVQTVEANAYHTNGMKREFNGFGDAVKANIHSFFAIHRKLASLLREMGGGKDRTILWDAIVRPMNERFQWEAVRREQAAKALFEIYKPILKAGGLRKKMFLPAIGDSFTLEGRLAVALNWGNELNRARIMDGEKWTADQAAAILETLTAEQLQFVNRLWEHIDGYWPEIAAKQRRVTGVEPVKVEAEPFQVRSADGQLVDMRGGYYPIKYETKRSDRSAADEKAEALNGAKLGLYTASTTRRGHTKARAEKVERPLTYKLTVPFQHITQVLHDLAFHEFLIDANRLIGSRDFEMAVRAHYNPEVLDTIKSTLEAVAVGEPQAEHAMDRMANYLRTGATIAGLGWNLVTSLLQPLGLTQSVARVGPKWMLGAVGRVFKDAASLHNSATWVGQKSDFMRTRTGTFMREVSEVANQVRATWKPNAWGPVEASFFWMIGRLQLVADIPTWIAQYDKSTAAGEDDATAVALADQAVRDTQGSGYLGDLAQIQRGNPWLKLWATFYSFFSVAHNMIAEDVAAVKRDPKNIPAAAVDVFLLVFVPVAIGEAIKRAVSGSDWDDFLPDVLKQIGGFFLGMFIGLRDLGSAITTDGQRPGSPGGARVLIDFTKLYQDGVRWVDTGDMPTRTRKDSINFVSPLLHLPAAQINRSWDGIEALASGATHNPLAVLFGPPRKAK